MAEGGGTAGGGCGSDIPDADGAEGWRAGAEGWEAGAEGWGAGADGRDCPGGSNSPRDPEAGTLRDADGGGSGIECGWLGRPSGGRIVDSCGATGPGGGVMEAFGDQIPGPCGAGGADGADGSNNVDGDAA